MSAPVHVQSDPIGVVVAALRARSRDPKAKGRGQWVARCPAHDDARASLSFSIAASGKFVARCFAGCTYDAILAALDLTSADLNPAVAAGDGLAPFSPARAGHTAHLAAGTSVRAGVQASANATELPTADVRAWRTVTRYEYTTADGAPVFVVERQEPAVQPLPGADGARVKRFFQSRPDGGRVADLSWRPLYRLPQVQEAKDTGRPILLVEGEKDAETAAALAAHGLTYHGAAVEATAHAGGAANWRPEYAAQLAGATVVILPDHDVPGHAWALTAAADLVAHGCEVRLLALPDLPPKGDLTDWCGAYGGATPAAAAACSALLGRSTRWVPGDPVPPPPARSRFTVLTDQELEALPPPTWLWHGLVPCGALAALIGQPGAGKSFVALDLAASIAAGIPALGRPALAGTVLYVAAEGTAGLPQRLAAWKHAHGHAGRRLPLYFVTQGVNLFAAGDEAHVVAACEQVATPDAPVRLVILDTLARVMPGGEENSAKDVGLVVEHAERIRRATGATVLLVHHTAKHSDQERGSSALRGAMDTILLVRTDDPDASAGAKLLVVEKQKDAAPAEPVVFTLDPVTAETPHGRVASCRVVLSTARWTDAAPEHDGPLTRTQLDALRVLRDTFGSSGATTTEWLDASGLARRTFYRARGVLERTNCVLNGVGRGQRYQVTRTGHEALKAGAGGTATGAAVGATDSANSVPFSATDDASRTSRARVEAHTERGGWWNPLRGVPPTPPQSVSEFPEGSVPRSDVAPPAVAPTPGRRTSAGANAFDSTVRRGHGAARPAGRSETPDEHRLPYRDFTDDEAPDG